MAIELDTNKKQAVGSVQAAKKAQTNLQATKQYKPPVAKPVKFKSTAKKQQNLQEMTPGPVIKNKIGDFKKTVSDERFVPVTFERATVKIKDPSTGLEFDEERAVPKYKTVFDTAIESVPKKKDAARLFYQVANAKPSDARSLYSRMTERDLKAFWSYAVANGKLNHSGILDDYKADRAKYAGAEYYHSKTAIVKHVEAQTKKQIEIAQNEKKKPLTQVAPTPNEQKLQELINRKQTTPTTSGLSEQNQNKMKLPFLQRLQQEAFGVPQATPSEIGLRGKLIDPQNPLQAGILGATSGLTSNLNQASLSPEEKARIQQLKGTPQQRTVTLRDGTQRVITEDQLTPYNVGEFLGSTATALTGEGAISNLAKVGAKQIVKKGIIAGAVGSGMQGVQSGVEGKNAQQIAKDMAIAFGLNVGADIGLNKLLGIIGKKVVTPEIKVKLEQNGFKVMDNGEIYKDGVLLKKSAKISNEIKTPDVIADAKPLQLSKGTSTTLKTTPSIIKPSQVGDIQGGKYTVTKINIPKSDKLYVSNKPYAKAVDEYNSAIEEIQNHFMTNELRQSEVDRILPELGIDINKLASNLEKTQAKIPLSKIGSDLKMKKAVGIGKTPSIRKTIEVPKAEVGITYPKGERTNVNQPTLSEAYALRKNQPSTIAPKPLKQSVGSEILPKGENVAKANVTPTATKTTAKAQTETNAVDYIKNKTGLKTDVEKIDVDSPYYMGDEIAFSNNGVTVQTTIKEDATSIELPIIMTKKSSDLGERVSGSGLGTKVVNELKNYADETGKELKIVGMTESAFPYWEKIKWLKTEYRDGEMIKVYKPETISKPTIAKATGNIASTSDIAQKQSKLYTNTIPKSDIFTPEELENLNIEYEGGYTPKANAETLANAKQRLAQNGAEAELAKLRSKEAFTSDDFVTSMEILKNDTLAKARQTGDYSQVKPTLDMIRKTGSTEAGRVVQAHQIYTRTPEGMLTLAQKVVDNVNKKFPKKKATLSVEDMKKIDEGMQNYQKLPDGFEKEAELAKVKELIADKVPADFVEKFRSLQRISWLLNPKTLIARNTLGNLLLQGAEGFKNMPATAIDTLVSLKTGKRTTTMAGGYLGGLKKGFNEQIRDIRTGVDTSPTGGQAEIPKGKVWDSEGMKGINKVINDTLNTLDKTVSNALKLGDRPFYEGAFQSRINQLKKINKTEEITKEMTEDARLYALEKTLQKDSAIAAIFAGIKDPKALAKYPGAQTIYKAFANTVLPFTKTPANILDKMFEYSPGGFIKAASQLGKKGDSFNQKYFVDNLARGLTGTGIMALGYAGAKNGFITGKPDKDKEVASVERLIGRQPYSFNVDGQSYTFDWAQPISALLAIGADAYNGGKDKKTFTEQLEGSAESAGNTFFNMSMLQGLTGLMEGYSPAVSFGKTIAEGTTGLATPTIGGQITRVIDPTMRETGGKLGPKLIAKTPLLSTKLPAKVDLFGREIKQSEGRGVVARSFENFLSPGYYSSGANSTPGIKEAYRVYKATGEKNVFPKLAPSSFTVKGEPLKLTIEEKVAFQKNMGERNLKVFNSIMENGTYKNMTDENKAKYLKKVVDMNYEKTKAEFLKKKLKP